MNSKAIRIAFLVVVILVCLSAALYAAHAYHQSRMATTNAIQQVDNNPHNIPTAQLETDRSKIGRTN